MSQDLNRYECIGRLGKDPVSKYLPSGEAIVGFSVAIGKQWRDKTSGEKKESTTWVNFVAFGKLGEICAKYLVKGSQVYCSGELRSRTWEKDGIKHHSTDIVLSSMQMIGGKSSERSSPQPAAQTTVKPDAFDDFGEEEIPFN
jgi:single-strand DNA-binding protein